MIFQQPAFLYGLFLLGIPVLIHLLNFRKSKTIYFSSLKFIEEIQTTNRNRRNLQDLLLLFLRILIMAMIILAFAQPEIRKNGISAPGNNGVTAIFIDNSPSMELTGNGQVLFSLAKDKAREIIGSFSPGNRFMLMTGDDENPGSRIRDREQAIQSLENLNISHHVKPLGEIIQDVARQIEVEGLRLSGLFLISDFQKNLFSGPLPQDSSETPAFFVPVRSGGIPNLSVDSCWFENPLHQPGQQDVLMARVHNRSDQTFNDFPVRLEINDTLRTEVAVSLPPLTAVTAAMPFTINTQGWQKGAVKLFDYPVTYDNDLFFTYRIESSIPVLLLYQGIMNQDLGRLFGNDSYFRFESYSLQGYPRTDFNDYRLLILNGLEQTDQILLKRTSDFLNNGGTVWFFPDMNGQADKYNGFLSGLGLPVVQGTASYPAESRLGSSQQEWLKSVVLNQDRRLRMPTFQKFFRFTKTVTNRVDLLTTVSNDPLITHFSVSGGHFVLSAFSLDRTVSDLMIHPLFIPLIYMIGSMSLSETSLYEYLGSEDPVRVSLPEGSRPDKPLRLVHTRSGYETIPAQQPGGGSEVTLFPKNLVLPGFYTLAAGEQASGFLAYNTERSESVLDFYADSIISNNLKSAGWKVTEAESSQIENSVINWDSAIKGKKLWPLLLFFALGLLLLESFVLNRNN